MKKPATIKALPVHAIDFGKNDGKFDAIERYFYDTGLVRDVERGDRTIITGRKGTGKTALAYHLKALADGAHNKFLSILSFKDIPISLMEEFTDSEHKQSNKFILLWQYIFLVEAAKCLTKDLAISDPHAEKLSAFIELNFPSLKRSPREYLRETVERKFKVDLKIAGGELNSKSEEKSDGILGLLPFTHALKHLLRDLARIGHRYLILVDELDDIYDDSSEYYNIIIGMFKAGMELNAFFKEESKSVKVIMFLRSDIYKGLAYSDKNKWSDMYHEINWIPEPGESARQSNLFHLINKRIGASLVDEPKDDEEYWDLVFPPYVVKNDLKPFQFILSRTHYRPRDVIQFCKEIQKENKKLNSIKSFDRRAVLNAEYSYSTWFKNEIIDEIKVKIPFIEEVFEAFRHHGQATFTTADINSVFMKFRIPSRMPLKSLLHTLFDFSVIGMFESEETAPVFSFRDPYVEFADGRIYSLHYGLRPALRIGGRFENRRQQGIALQRRSQRPRK